MNTAAQRTLHTVLVFFGVVIASSAYLAYTNGADRLPISLAFLLFSLFAVFGSFLFPTSLSRKSISPLSSFRSWRDSLHAGGLPLLLLASGCYVGSFFFLLSSLKADQEGVVLTVLVLQLANPLLNTFAARVFLGHKCERWSWYVVGALLTPAGILVYKGNLFATQGVSVFDRVTIFMAATILLDCGFSLLRHKYSRDHKVDGTQAMRSVQIISAFAGAVWIVLDPAPLPSMPVIEEILALAYLGIVPTAIGGIIFARAIDVVGFPLVESIKSLRPISALALGLLPLSLLKTEVRLSQAHFLGIGLAIAGVVIVMALARPKPVR